jgi:predicted acylesterase/phospholipase RssA
MDKKIEKPVKPKAKRRARLPKTPFANIAISLSGGGFRGASIHLGVMSYLSTQLYQGITLLERIRVISTVSGGTFLGAKYVSTLKKGGTFEDCYKSLVDFMTGKDLVEEALEYLAEDKNWTNGRQRSLINAFASIYHKDFEPEAFGILWNKSPEIHLKEISFNATEFHFALPFHFHKSALSHAYFGYPMPEFIGNKKIHIPAEVAREIRLADIIAASSCVPFGFEPINFPNDFIHPESVKLRDQSLFSNVFDGEKIDYPVGLMDGGVDDNQGVDAVITAEERMKSYPESLKDFRSNDKKSVDLYIISDGTNPNMRSYAHTTRDNIPVIGKWSFKTLKTFGIASFVIGFILFVCGFVVASKPAIIGLSVLGTLGMVIAFVFLIFSKGFVGLTKRLGVPAFFLRRMRHVDKLKFGVLNNLLINRRNSVTKMITKVFIKQMRWFGFERIFSDPAWKPRLILNTIFELTSERVEKRKSKYPHFNPEILEPGEKIKAAAAKALRKGTTLWFTADEMKGEHSMTNSIIACGQFTVCFNLLEYYEKFLWNKKYQNNYEKYGTETKQALEQLHASLSNDWQKFKEDPYWMVNEWKKKIWPGT